MTKSLNLPAQQQGDIPFFSIIIPTKNRHFLVSYAIQSVLFQSFSNYEIIVVDNDDSMQTQEVVSRYDDARIRYFRTGNLSMADNWEYGLNQVRGKYILVLEDKMALKSDALIKINETVAQYPDYSICWRNDCYNEATDTFESAQDCNGTLTLLSTDRLIKSFLESDFLFFINNSPRGLNSCTPIKVIDKIRLGPMKNFFLPLSPDFNSVFQLCVYTDYIVCLNESLVIMGGLNYSNGQDAYIRGHIHQRFLKDNNVMSDNELYEYVPLKIYSLRNELFNEFFKFSQLNDGKLTKYSLNVENYYLFIYDELKLVQTMGKDTSSDIRKWLDAIDKLDSSTKQKILSGMKDYDHKYQRNSFRQFCGKIIKSIQQLFVTKISPHLPFTKQKNILNYTSQP